MKAAWQMPGWDAAPWILLVVVVWWLVSRAAAHTGKPIQATLWSVCSGLAGIGMVNLLAPVTAVVLPLNWLTCICGVLLGIPGVITLLLLRVLLHVA